MELVQLCRSRTLDARVNHGLRWYGFLLQLVSILRAENWVEFSDYICGSQQERIQKFKKGLLNHRIY